MNAPLVLIKTSTQRDGHAGDKALYVLMLRAFRQKVRDPGRGPPPVKIPFGLLCSRNSNAVNFSELSCGYCGFSGATKNRAKGKNTFQGSRRQLSLSDVRHVFDLPMYGMPVLSEDM